VKPDREDLEEEIRMYEDFLTFYQGDTRDLIKEMDRKKEELEKLDRE
jgi:hypothetical protein